MTRDQAQLISFDKIYNLDNYEENFCSMNSSTDVQTFLCAVNSSGFVFVKDGV